jgi:uronate dehydrogenase
MKDERVLISGAAGLVGQVLMKGLSERRTVVGIDRRPVRGSQVKRVAMTDQRAAARALRGQHVLVDLASAHWQQPWKVVHENNLPATWNALEAARQCGVRRVVYASSCHVIGQYEQDEPYASILRGEYGGLEPGGFEMIGVDAAVRPDTPYGVGKAFGEAAARYYAETFGLSVICLRIGSLNWSGRPASARHFSTFITHPDMVRLVEACIDAPAEVGFAIVYGISANRWRIWDLEPGRRLGYAPVDDAETWRSAM